MGPVVIEGRVSFQVHELSGFPAIFRLIERRVKDVSAAIAPQSRLPAQQTESRLQRY